MSIYADTNFFSFLYLEDPGSGKAEALLRQHHHPILPITWLLRVEVINSFEQAVFSGYGAAQIRIARKMAAACQQAFRDDLRDGVALRVVDVPLSQVTQTFEEIALRQTAKHGFRAYDILHVASALVLKRKSFWSFDQRANKLAKLEGLKTI